MSKYLVLIFLFFSSMTYAVEYQAKNIGLIRTVDSMPCVFFKLEDVRGEDLFAIPRSHAVFQGTLIMLTLAKMHDKPINVVTTNRTACGHAEVRVIHLP
jgi:hypothetical protein